MIHRCLIPVVACLFLILGNSISLAQDDAKTHEVKEQFFQVLETVTGTVESRAMTPLAADTENWTTLKIKQIVPEGTAVKSGDVIVEFDTEDLERKIDESRQATELGEFTLQESELELEQLNKTLPLDQTMAERKMRIAEQDYKYFVDVDKPNQERSIRRSVENSQHSLEYATEEYNQLKRMYEEDELTEESEEIVLKRTQRDVENRQFFLEQAQLRAAKTLDFDLPRSMEEKVDALERSRLEHQRSQVTMPLERQKKKVALEKAKYSYDKELKDLAELEADMDRMTIRATSDGVVYYGRCERGKWLGQTGPQRNLDTGKTVVHDKPLVTVVDPGNLMLRADLTEKQLGNIRNGSQGLAKPAAFPDDSTEVTVANISMVPVAADKFDCQMDLASATDGLMPGMSCEVRFLIYENAEALTVPESAVFTDDGISHYVFVAGEGDDAEPERRTVTAGMTADKKTEISDGLSVGDNVLLTRPN